MSRRLLLSLVAILALSLAPDGAHAAEAAGGDGEHGTYGNGKEKHLEHYDMLPHLFQVLRYTVFSDSYEFYKYSKMFEAPFFAALAVLFLSLVARRLYKNRSELPDRLQALFEILVEQTLNITNTMMGEKYGRKYAPFVATIFVYLLVQNYSGIIPLGKAPSAVFLNNFSIALCVFLYVQYTGLKRQGLGGYLHHLAGAPNNFVGWLLAPLMFVLELIGEFAKPISLSLRLFGNIFGKDMLLAVFALLGVVALSALPTDGWIGLPLHLPFFFLALLLGLIQALVFALLTTVYISMMLPHDHEHEPLHQEDEAHA
jgi:F-type H+-transporting ATPase subunit a